MEPVVLWPWIALVLKRSGLPGPRGRVPLPLARVAGAACELWWSVARRSGEPPLTRFVALQLAREHTYDLGPAWRDFGYVERISTSSMTDRVAAWLRAEVIAARL